MSKTQEEKEHNCETSAVNYMKDIIPRTRAEQQTRKYGIGNHLAKWTSIDSGSKLFTSIHDRLVLQLRRVPEEARIPE